MNKMDLEHKVSSSSKADLVFNYSGPECREREKVFKEVGGVWSYEELKRIILDRYELKHELDCSMVENAYKNRGHHNVSQTYIVHDPLNNVEGTDLFPADCVEEDLDSNVDLS